MKTEVFSGKYVKISNSEHLYSMCCMLTLSFSLQRTGVPSLLLRTGLLPPLLRHLNGVELLLLIGLKSSALATIKVIFTLDCSVVSFDMS